jgi:hypothetical protein
MKKSRIVTVPFVIVFVRFGRCKVASGGGDHASVSLAMSRKKKGRESPAQFRGKSVGTLGETGSGLPERFRAFAVDLLRLKPDVAQKVRVKMRKPLAVAAADECGAERSQAPRENSHERALRKCRDMGLGHLCLLRFVLIQFACFGKNNVIFPRNESPEDYCD